MSDAFVDILGVYILTPKGSPVHESIENTYREQDYCSLHLELLPTSRYDGYQHLREPSVLDLMLSELQKKSIDESAFGYIDTILDLAQFLDDQEKLDFEKTMIHYRDYFSQCLLFAMLDSAEGWLSQIYDYIQKNERITMSFLMHSELTSLIKEELEMVHNDGEDWTEFLDYPLFSLWFGLRNPTTEDEQKWLVHHQLFGYHEETVSEERQQELFLYL